ncbi:MAG TPA: LPS assembly lipoprotein LptE [Caldimonas sp.]|jgi:LPS-assembly lipoprotein|nr:LPS assembly lipoprotein LptE [Caldimonas sp.]HEX4236137.1 LPS assembly lipoprotein LptE [Caldimonas sp.]
MRRRIALGAALMLAGCGFELKRPPALGFGTIQLSGFAPRSPLAAELKTSLDASPTTHVVEAGQGAQVVLQALTESREKVVVAQTSANQIREFELRLRFGFRLQNATGKELIPDSEILQTRSLTYTETAALGKEQEEAFLYRAMQSDIVSQLLRRLASVRLL